MESSTAPVTESHSGPRPGSRTLDPAEVARFDQLAGQWWDPKGKFRPLHRQGPARLTFIRDQLLAHFGRQATELRCLKGLSILDVGCGGGLICEPLFRLGAAVTGIDPSAEAIAVARRHGEAQGLEIDYRSTTAEDLLATGARFDVVTCLEVVEHVPDVGALLKTLSALVHPGGIIVLSTLNRTWKAWALAIVGAEYVLGWLPRGTHDWNRFVTPDELARHIQAAGFQAPRFSGLVYDLVRDTWRLDPDCDVNYLAAAPLPG